MLIRAVVATTILGTASLATAQTPLIPRAELFAPIERQLVKVSYDGATLSFLAPKDGTWQIWTAPTESPHEATAVTQHPFDITGYEWTYDSQTIVFTAAPEDGPGQHVFAYRPNNGVVKDLTPDRAVFARIEKLSPHLPHQIVISTNARNRSLPDLEIIDLKREEREKLFVNDGLSSIVVDNTLTPRLGTRFTQEGDLELVRMTSTGFEPVMRIAPEDQMTTNVLAHKKDSILLLDARGRNTVAVIEKSLSQAKERVIAADPEADVVEVLLDPNDHTVQAAAVTFAKKTWSVLDKSLKDDFALLRAVDEGDMRVESRSLDGGTWVVSFESGSAPRRYFLYEREQERATLLFSDRSILNNDPLAETEPVLIKAPDGTQLTAYLTRPIESTSSNSLDSRTPLVVVVHDGPWARDTWSFQPIHQWLANRGYAALSVNYRGSTGFGKNFLNAGNQEWGGAIFDDVLAGVHWAIDQRVADPDRIAILGTGFGGYIASLGATLTPTRFSGVVNIGGALDLVTFVKSMPTYWPPLGSLVRTRIGDIDSKESMRKLYDQSPLSFAHRLKTPVLMIHGDDDALVPAEHIQPFAAQAEIEKVPFTSVRFEQGSDILTPGNESLAALALVERFLGRHLGGRVEPVGPESRGVIVRFDHGAEEIGIANVPVGGNE